MFRRPRPTGVRPGPMYSVVSVCARPHLRLLSRVEQRSICHMPTHYDGEPAERAALEAYIKLWRAAHAVEAVANRHLADHSLTISQFSVLEALYHLGPLGQRVLARKILRSSGNLTLVIDNLERDGLVRREREAKDRRMVTVHLTERGQALIARIIRPHVQGIVGVFAALDSKELTHLAALCRKLGLSLQET